MVFSALTLFTWRHKGTCPVENFPSSIPKHYYWHLRETQPNPERSLAKQDSQTDTRSNISLSRLSSLLASKKCCTVKTFADFKPGTDLIVGVTPENLNTSSTLYCSFQLCKEQGPCSNIPMSTARTTQWHTPWVQMLATCSHSVGTYALPFPARWFINLINTNISWNWMEKIALKTIKHFWKTQM